MHPIRPSTRGAVRVAPYAVNLRDSQRRLDEDLQVAAESAGAATRFAAKQLHVATESLFAVPAGTH